MTIANGTVDFTNASTTFGQFVPASCNIGFRRIGGTSIECLADGTWSKSVTCELVGRLPLHRALPICIPHMDIWPDLH